MSLKKRIKLIEGIEKGAKVTDETYEDGTSVRVVLFPLDWWFELKRECIK